MNRFTELYAAYYDLLYKDKDYQQETNYVRALVQRFCPAASTLLDLGCGTGRHAEFFAQQGWQVHGIDCSEAMLTRARERAAARPESLSFSHADARTLQLNQTFDVVTALFHVLSYQTSAADLEALFARAAAHLKPGGLFIFDFWYGPAVLTDPPVVRVKRLENERIKVTRIAEPQCYAPANLVQVDYDLFFEDKQNGLLSQLQEQHLMRYLFDPELDLLCQQAGLQPVVSYRWLTEQAADFSSWNVVRVVRK